MNTVAIIAVLIAICATAAITWFAASAYRTQVYEKKIGSAEERSREIIDEAIKRSEKRNVGHFMDVILSKRYDTNDMVVLREKDFLK